MAMNKKTKNNRSLGAYTVELDMRNVEALEMLIGNDLDNQYEIVRGDPDDDERRRYVRSINLSDEFEAERGGEPVFQFSEESMELIEDLIESWEECFSLGSSHPEDAGEERSYRAMKGAIEGKRLVCPVHGMSCCCWQGLDCSIWVDAMAHRIVEELAAE